MDTAVVARVDFHARDVKVQGNGVIIRLNSVIRNFLIPFLLHLFSRQKLLCPILLNHIAFPMPEIRIRENILLLFALPCSRLLRHQHYLILFNEYFTRPRLLLFEIILVLRDEELTFSLSFELSVFFCLLIFT